MVECLPQIYMIASLAQLRPRSEFLQQVRSVQLFLVVDIRKLKTEDLKFSESTRVQDKKWPGFLIGHRCSLYFSYWTQMVGESRTHTH